MCDGEALWTALAILGMDDRVLGLGIALRPLKVV